MRKVYANKNMSEKLLPPPQNHHITAPEHLEGYKPLGQTAVVTEDGRVAGLHHADYHDQAYEYAAQFADLPDPRYVGKTKQFVRSVLGRSSVTNDLAEWLDDNHEMNLELVANQHQNNAGWIRKYEVDKAEDRDRGLKSVRKRLHGLDAAQKTTLNGYLAHEAPEFFEDIYNEWQPGDEKGRDEASWLAHAPRRQLLNFLQWHNDRIERINKNPDTQERLAAERRQYVGLVQAAVREGDLPPNALDRLAAVDTVPTYIGDVFDTVMEERAGYHKTLTGEVVLQEGYEPGTHFHELNHAVLGKMSHQIFTEAMTEHVSLSLMYGNFHIMDPVARDEEGYYENYRRLMSNMMRSGLNGDLMPAALRAYCANDTQSKEYQAYEEKLMDSYGGIDVNEFIDTQMIEAYELVEDKRDTIVGNSEDFAVNHAAAGIKYLGSILKGKTDDEILAPSIRRVESLNTSPEMAATIIEKLTVGRRRQLAGIRRYVSEHRASVAA